ncbi:MAG TPA: hypothetical protein PLM53_01715 [Spirochaetota bacterium]|nr:hypothetical protein [Spirochaetota bacterium]HPC41130.1 hypothetical protein [Spirochaetota bacterium]HPL15552.1 hypothetical protein [Spirochaetota bacterium]HQF07050.1 hypothetical protein [Spirochaetota bacterium]HQH95787.1 hypothetical protein [Spirochaetota bacterium]
MNTELEYKVLEQTRELRGVNETLRKEIEEKKPAEQTIRRLSLGVVGNGYNFIVIDAEHPAKLDFTATNTAGEGSTCKMIGSNEDADNHLLNGGKTGCGSVASAAPYRGTDAGHASEVTGLFAMMALPLGLILATRRMRRRGLRA